MRARPLVVAAVLTLLLGAAAARAADVCAATDADLTTWLQRTTAELSAETVKAVKDDAAEKLKSKPTSDGLAEGGRLDLLRRAFVGFSLGEIKDEDGQAVFNFNPLAVDDSGFGQISPRAIVHKPSIYGPLDKKLDALDAGVRSAKRDEITKSLGELDDYELKVRWAPRSQTPIHGLQRIADEIFAGAKRSSPKTLEIVTAATDEIAGALGLSGPVVNPKLAEVCANPAAKARLEKLAADLAQTVKADNAALAKTLTDAQYFALADLIEGEPRWVLDVGTRQRAGAAGPDEASAALSFQWGWISYRGARAFARRRGLAFDAAAIAAYRQDHAQAKDALPLFTLSAEYGRARSFAFGLPGLTEAFAQDGTHRLTAKASAGVYLGEGYAHRLELSAAYDDVSDDPKLQNRFVAELTWVERLNQALAQFTGGSELVVTAVYANKPRFRGDVNEELGVRAGLKWSFGTKKAAPAK